MRLAAVLHVRLRHTFLHMAGAHETAQSCMPLNCPHVVLIFLNCPYSIGIVCYVVGSLVALPAAWMLPVEALRRKVWAAAGWSSPVMCRYAPSGSQNMTCRIAQSIGCWTGSCMTCSVVVYAVHVHVSPSPQAGGTYH